MIHNSQVVADVSFSNVDKFSNVFKSSNDRPQIQQCPSSFLAATKQLYKWYFLSVCPSVTPFSLCYPHRIIMKISGVITND